MLIINDLVRNKKINDLKKYTIEILYNGERQLRLLKNKFNIVQKPYYVNKISKYYLSNSQKYIFHDVEKYLPLHLLLKFNIADNDNLKYCSEDIQCAIDYCKIKFFNNKVDDWVKSIRYYNICTSTKLQNLTIKKINRLNSISNSLTGFVISYKNINTKKYELVPFDIYSLKDIVQHHCYDRNFNFNKILINSRTSNCKDISFVQWKRASHQDKLNCIYDIVIAIMINEEIYPYYELNYEIPTDLYKCFNRAFMKLCCSSMRLLFINYSIEYYLVILNKFRNSDPKLIRKDIEKKIKNNLYEMYNETKAKTFQELLDLEREL